VKEINHIYTHTHTHTHTHTLIHAKLIYFTGNLLNKKSIEIGGTVIPLKRTNLIPNLFPEKPFPSVRIAGSSTESRKSR
jgi:hypothetical protein